MKFDNIDAKALAKNLTVLLKTAKETNPRNYGTVVCFDGIWLVATDGFRLTRIKAFDIPVGKFCLSVNACKLIQSLKNERLISLELSDDETELTVISRTAKLTVKTSYVTYPNYLSVIPNNKNSDRINPTLDTPVIKSLLDKSDKSNCIDFKGFNLNGKFLLEAIKTCSPKETIVFEYSDDPLKPVSLTQGKIQHVIVPITKVA